MRSATYAPWMLVRDGLLVSFIISVRGVGSKGCSRDRDRDREHRQVQNHSAVLRHSTLLLDIPILPGSFLSDQPLAM